MECFNCNHQINGKYCSNCGRPIQPVRIDGKYIVTEIGGVLSFKKGILFTIKELLIRPGQNIKAFILEDRYRLVKPVVFVIFCSFIYTILQRLLHFEDGYIRYNSDTRSTALVIFEWTQGNYGYANIVLAIFIAGWIKILFRKHNYNFYEILILLLFVFGVGMLIYSFFGILQTLTNLELMSLSGVIGFVYSSWAIGQFFDQKKIANYVKAFLSYLLGLLSAVIIAILIGMLIDLMIKH